MKKKERRNLLSLAAQELTTEEETQEFLRNIGDEEYHFIVSEESGEIKRYDKLYFVLDLVKSVKSLELPVEQRNDIFAYHMQEAMNAARSSGKIEEFEKVADQSFNLLISQRLRLEKKGDLN